MRYVCLLRGINVGGNNKVPMGELKACFEDMDFRDVSTYINSGNVLFRSSVPDVLQLIAMIETALAKWFNLDLRVTVVTYPQLAAAMAHPPTGWGADVTRKHNLLFVRPPVTAADVMVAIGVTKPDLETVAAGDGVVYWSASLEHFGRTASSKFAGRPIYQDVTVRNHNTSRELPLRLEAMSADE